MEAAKSLTYAAENTIICPTLLLRSHSNPTPSVCECGSCFHEEIPVNVLPNKFFTAKPGKLVSAINTLVENICKQKVGSNNPIHYTSNKMSKMTSSAVEDKQYWWNNLLFVQGEKSESLTPFTLILRALIRFEDVYANSRRNCLTEIINICRSCDHKKRPDYKSTRLKFYIGLSSYVNSIDMFCWSPGSRDIAFEYVLAWSNLLINETGSQDIGRSNLAPESFGVIENWAEYLSTGKLSSKSSRFIQVEPEPPSIFHELDSSNVSENPIHLATKEIVIAKNPEAETTNSHNNSRHRSVTLIIDTGESCTVEEKLMNTNPELYKLSKVWESVVAKQLENVNNTIVYKIGEPLDSLITSVTKFWGHNRCTICSESN